MPLISIPAVPLAPARRYERERVGVMLTRFFQRSGNAGAAWGSPWERGAPAPHYPGKRALFGWALIIAAGVCVTQGAPATSKAEDGKALFDGKSLAGWMVTDFYKPGAVKVDPKFRDGAGAVVAETGVFLTGITWAKDDELPRTNYEISLEAMKVDGGDFFCGLTFPVGKSGCSLIVGGWGGTVVGLSSIDDNDASENETSQGKDFALNRWYRLRVRVTDARIQAWIDDERIVDLETKDRKIDVRGGEIERSLPLGIAAYQTKAAWRNIRLRRL